MDIPIIDWNGDGAVDGSDIAQTLAMEDDEE